MFGFQVSEGKNYKIVDYEIGKPLAGKVINHALAKQCYNFHQINMGNNNNDKVIITFLARGLVKVKNLVTGKIALLDIKNTDM